VLYETAARSAEVLGLDVPDLDLPNRRARVRRKGGQLDTIVWQTGTARLLPRLLRGRTAGPVFLTDRRSRVELPPGDIDPASGRARLSYWQAEDLFKSATGGATLHQLRHSALTHDAEDGVNTAMLQARSGHTSVRSHPLHPDIRRGAGPAPGRTRPGPAAVASGWPRDARHTAVVIPAESPRIEDHGQLSPGPVGYTPSIYHRGIARTQKLCKLA
jgi:hypothetical protein